MDREWEARTGETVKLGDDEGEKKRGVARGDGKTLVISVLKGNVAPD